MVGQYPHILFALVDAPATQNPATGDWVPGSSSNVELSECRLEPGGGGNLITLTDGSQYAFQNIVYIPLSAQSLKEGDRVRVTDDDANVLCEAPVKRFSRGQLNMRLWL